MLDVNRNMYDAEYPFVNHNRLSDAELDELGDFLSADDAPETRLPLVACEGFLMGVISSPDLIPPSQWLPIVLGSADEPAFQDLGQAKRITSLLMRWYNGLLHELHDDLDGLDLRIGDRTGAISALAAVVWANGYFEAMRLQVDRWSVMEREPEGEFLEPIFTLLGCTEKPKNRKRKATSAARKLAASVEEIYEYWLEQRSLPRRRAEPKIGRNDACSCGSGRKYKRCCGA